MGFGAILTIVGEKYPSPSLNKCVQQNFNKSYFQSRAQFPYPQFVKLFGTFKVRLNSTKTRTIVLLVMEKN